MNANQERYRERNKAFVRGYLETHPCVDCGQSDPAVLEFDHIDEKTATVSQLKWASAPLEKIMSEIERCEVRCVNCHMRRTAQQFGWRKARGSATDAGLLEMRD